jgi:hypothetical protein
MLPEAPTYQAVAADVDGDGVRDVVRMVASGEGAIALEAWRLVAGAGWERIGQPLLAIPSHTTGEPSQLFFAGATVRLLVRRADGIERATLVRQPRFDEPGQQVGCCLVLHDLAVRDGALELVEVAEQMPNADAVLALDMDGDATDELLVTRGLPPLGDTTFPTDARLLRWSGDRFRPPVLTELLIGSGVSPFILGDSDGIPGVEAAFIGAQSRLHRVSMRAGDTLVAESAEVSMLDALAVPLGDERGIATVNGLSGLEVRSWPRDAPPGSAAADSPLTGDLIGVVATADGTPGLVLGSLAVVHLPLPQLAPVRSLMTPSARTLEGPLRPFVGMLPGGGPDGEPAFLAGGELGSVSGDPRRTSTLAGLVPVGLVGPERSWLALWHGQNGPSAPDPRGGRLEVPTLEPGSAVSLVPFDQVPAPEEDGGILVPPTSGAVIDGDELLVGTRGFSATIQAPPGSRIYTQDDPLSRMDAHVVPASGSLVVTLRPADDATPGSEYRPRAAVVTPSGRSYLATWSVTVLNGEPELAARAETVIGSSTVAVVGEADPSTDVRVGGRDVTVDAHGRFTAPVDLPPWPTEVEVVATDRVGNQSRVTVIGVGWFDYRALPWTVIAIIIVAVAGAILTLRAPRATERPRPVDEDGVLEELDPEG